MIRHCYMNLERDVQASLSCCGKIEGRERITAICTILGYAENNRIERFYLYVGASFSNNLLVS